MSDSIELLFFDTFAHENSEELNLDLVQFPKPVYVTEVRIIPLGARVQADFPGGVRLGATNPSQFRIEFFVNDLGKPGASTFETLGGFEYNQNGCINLECVPDDTIRKIPTDGLVLRGWYTTITLAVYGTLTANISEQIIPPVVTPALPAQPNTIADVQQIIPQSSIETEWPQETVQPVPLEYTPQAATPYPQTYPQTETYQQEYPEYYNEVPKDPRSYHHTPESDWENKNRGRSMDVERDRERDRERSNRDVPYQKSSNIDHEHSRIESDRRERDRERRYSRSHSRDRDRQSRDYPDSNRDRDHQRDWDHDRHDYRDRSKKDWDRSERSDRDRDRDRSFEHQDSYRRYGREDREEPRKRPRTPPMQSPKRPHTPHVIEHAKNLSPPDVETLSEDEQSIAEKQKKEKEVPESTRTSSKSPIKDVKENQSPVNNGNEEAPSMDVEEFEPILSDEDILDDADHYQDLDYDYNTYTNNDDLIKMFIPGCTDLQKYRIHLPYVIQEDKFEIDEELKTTIAIADDFFKSSITKYTLMDFEKLDREIKEELVHLCEKIMPTIGDVAHFCCIVEIYAKIKNPENSQAKELFAQVKYIVETILDWFIIMLNYDMANSQNQPGYKIRHIKWGARLAEWCCSSIHFIELLWERNFHIDQVLLSLYTREYMALSVKLMILRALDKYLQHKSTVKKFIIDGIDVAEHNGYCNNVLSHESNGYKTLVELLRENPLVRLKFALNSILKKLNLFEVLQKLQSTVGKAQNENCTLSNEDISFMVKSLDQILHACHSGSFALSQPKRFLPVSAQFEVNRIDTQNVLIEFFKMFNLLQCFVVLLTQSNTMNKSSVKAPIYEILCELLLTKEGLEYLCENCDTVNLLLKCLLQSDEDLQFSLSDFAEVKSHNLGLEIAYKVQCLYHVHCLLDIGKKFEYDCDSTDVINQLHALFCLTFSNIGKISVCEILGMDDNIRCLMQFLELANVREKSELHFMKLRKSPAMSYIVDLLSFAIVNVPNIPILEKYSKQLLQVVLQHEAFEPYISTKLNELMPFVKPFEYLMPLNYDNISAIVELVAKHMDYATTYPGQLITGLRILQLLGISRHANKLPVTSENPLSNYIELKYKHVILQLYSLDGVTILTKLLQKIADFYEQPALHTYVFVSVQGVHIINTVQPAVELLKQMLTYVIQCRNTNFKDLTSIPVLLQTYTLLHSFPSNSLLYLKARNTCRDLIETLLVYTQPVSDEIHEKDSLNKTLWTLMCGEVIKYITTAPYTFVPGLLIFSELLPLPLPIQTLEKLSDDEVSWMINLRKLWSAHLHSHTCNIQELLARMCTTTHQPLLNLLKRICVQLSDLAANSAIMIARGILDTIHSALIPKDESKFQVCNGHVARLLYFLACLMTHGSLKCAILQLLQNNVSSVKGDEKYPALIDVFSQILKLQNNSSSHVQTQECILNIIQSFSDTEITLLQASLEEYGALSSEVYLANALPRKEHLVLYISTIIEHLMNIDNSLVTYLPIVRTLVLLTEHDYGFYFLRECLNKKLEPLLNILNKLEKSFSKDNDDCLSILNIVIQFLQVCSTPEEVEGPVLFKPRTMKMSVADIRAVVGWKTQTEENEPKHPINVLEDHLKNIVKEDNTLKSLLENTSALIKLLSSEQTSDVKENHTEPVLPPPEPLLVQFAHRTVFAVTETIDERFTSAYWLSVPTDDADNDLENVTCDLTEVCRQHLPQEINLIREVEKLCRIYPSDGLEQTEKEKRNDSQKDKMRRPFVTPTRGRGFARTVPQRGDLFRSRPPNTSRPPSLHVDDFVALETCGAQPTGPTGYNKISRELLATSRVARGTRGRPFMMPERAVQYRQVPWWGVGIGRTPYQ